MLAGILDRLRSVQMLDACDIEGALVLYTRMLADVAAAGKAEAAGPNHEGEAPPAASVQLLGKRARSPSGSGVPEGQGAVAAAGSVPALPAAAASYPPTLQQQMASSRKLPRFGPRGVLHCGASSELLDEGLDLAEAEGSRAAPLLDWPTERAAAALRAYLASATAKDCGVMISMQRICVSMSSVAPALQLNCPPLAPGEVCVVEMPSPASGAVAAPAASTQLLSTVEEGAAQLPRSPVKLLLIGLPGGGYATYVFKVGEGVGSDCLL